MEQTPPPDYRAFISYSHQDVAFASRLHRRLETYRLPRRLTGSPSSLGPVPARLTPIFRDREDLPAADSLSAAVRGALARSGSLVVVCSPAAARSVWVALEISAFRALHPDRPILAALVAGEPATAFPPGLAEAEPLAADFRPMGDGGQLALHKLVAGLVGVDLDQLVQRQAQRRLRHRLAAATAGAATLCAAGFVGVMELDARATARQHVKTEALVESLLVSLNTQAKTYGDSALLDAASRDALAHYAAQDLRRLPPGLLQQRAVLLQGLGQDDMRRGNYPAARRKFTEAGRTTSALLKADPDNPDYLFAESQSLYWTASLDMAQRRYPSALAAFSRKREVTARLAALPSSNRAHHTELAYAEWNLCTIHEYGFNQLATAARHCRVAQDLLRRARDAAPTDMALAEHLVMLETDVDRLRGRISGSAS